MMGDFNVSDEGRTQISIYTTKYDSPPHRLPTEGNFGNQARIR